MSRLSLQRKSSSSRGSAPVKQERRVRNRKSRKSSRSEPQKIGPKAKAAHIAVERRYRDKLNDNMMQLHRTLIASEFTARVLGEPAEPSDLFSESSDKVRKAQIMTNAINYVYQSDVEIRHMSNEIEQLQNRLRHLEKLVRCEDCSSRKLMAAN